MSIFMDDPVPPPPRATPGQSIPLNQVWHILPATTRHKTLQALSRVVAQHLVQPPVRQEVAHDGD